MHRPIGITILALLAGLAGLFEVWRALVFLGVVNFEFIGKPVSFDDPQWGPAFWAAVLALIWFWVAAGLWNVRAYAWQFGNFIAIFTVIFGFFALLGGNPSTTEAETVGWFLALIVLFYLNYPGVRDQFIQHEMSLMTPEQRAAFDQMQAAQVAMAHASATAATAPPLASTAAPAAPPPAAPPPPASTPTPPAPPAPPADTGGTSST